MQRKNIFSLLTLFVLALFVFTGCNKEKEEVVPTAQSYVGVWKLESYDYRMFAGGTSMSYDKGTGTTETLELKVDGNVVEKDEYNSQTAGKWTLSGKQINFTFASDAYPDFVENGTFDVKEVTATRLVLYKRTVASTVNNISTGEEVTVIYKK
jgi:hypothetical protein